MHIHPTKKLGVNPRPAHVKTCKLANYIDFSKFPTPPPIVDWQVEAPAATQLFENDKVGDCAIVGYLHIKEIILAAACKKLNLPAPVLYTDAEAISLYSAATLDQNKIAYTPTDPTTDTGLNLVEFLEFLRKQGQILAHAEINLLNDQEVQISRYMFGGIYRAFNLPAAAETMGTKWNIDPTVDAGLLIPGGWGGHCVNDKARDSSENPHVTSWGEDITVYPTFLINYQSEGHIIVFPESDSALDTFAGGNFGLQDLINDLNQLKNN